MKIKLVLKYSVLVLILTVLVANIFFSLTQKDNLLALKSASTSFSKSDSYFSRLNLWYYFAGNQDWKTASLIEGQLSSPDLLDFKRHHDPVYLQRQAQTISQKGEQTVEDWVELSKIYVNLNQTQNAIDALSQARRLDPLRVDLEQIEIEIKK